MARVTVEDCLENVDNRFQLVLVATKRARQISLGSEPYIEEDNDKPTVLALREIAEGFVTRDILDEPDEAEVIEFVSAETDGAEEGQEGEQQSADGADDAGLDALAAALQAELAGDAAGEEADKGKGETVEGTEEPEQS